MHGNLLLGFFMPFLNKMQRHIGEYILPETDFYAAMVEWEQTSLSTFVHVSPHTDATSI